MSNRRIFSNGEQRSWTTLWTFRPYFAVASDGQKFVCVSCLVEFGLSFELLATIIRAKLGSGGRFTCSCCLGALIFTPDGNT